VYIIYKKVKKQKCGTVVPVLYKGLKFKLFNPFHNLSVFYTRLFHVKLPEVDLKRSKRVSVVPEGVQLPPPKFRSFDKAEPNSQFREKYIRNNPIRIRVSLLCKLSGTPE
jgi:hypothetical protein